LEYDGQQTQGNRAYFVSLTPKTEGKNNVTLKILRNNEPATLSVKGGKLGVNLKVRYPEGGEAFESRTLLGYGKLISGIGWIVIVLAVLAVFGGLVTGQTIVVVAVGGVITAIIGISLVASGQAISCLVSIERNTRTTYEILRERSS